MLILVAQTDDLDWYIASNQQWQNTNAHSKPQQDHQKDKCYAKVDSYCTANCIQIDLMFQENFSTDTQVRNSLSHRNDRRQSAVIWVTYGCDNIKPYWVRNISHQEVKCSTVCMCLADNQLITNRCSCKVKGCNTMTSLGYRTKQLVMMAIQMIHEQERGTHILSLHGRHWF